MAVKDFIFEPQKLDPVFISRSVILRYHIRTATNQPLDHGNHMETKDEKSGLVYNGSG